MDETQLQKSPKPFPTVVMAQKPEEMQAAQEGMIAWAQARIDEHAAEIADLEENLAVAQKNKWRTSTIRTAVNNMKRRKGFYERTLAALQAGYVMVPNFPVGTFAVRTSKKLPKGHRCLYAWESEVPDAKADGSPPGEGRYVDDEPYRETRYGPHKRSNGTVEENHEFFTPTEFDENIRFPFTFAKPQILKATSRAMALKVFDELGCLPAPNRRARPTAGDPIIVGRIVHKEGWSEKVFTFMVAWFMDLSKM